MTTLQQLHSAWQRYAQCWQPWSRVKTLDDPWHREVVEWRRYGTICVERGTLTGIHFRPYPLTISRPEVWWDQYIRRPLQGDCVRLYYDQHAAFLILKYMVAGRGTQQRTLNQALRCLDEVAAVKRSLSILLEAANSRITDRMLRRYGYQRHLEDAAGRHFIKRFDLATISRPRYDLTPNNADQRETCVN